MTQSGVDRSSWHRFATAYARALHEAGAPAPTVEEEVTRALAARGVAATVMATPTALWIDVDGSRVVRVTPGATDLSRQVELAALGQRVVDGLDPDQATEAIELGAVRVGPWSPLAQWVAYLAVSVGAAVALGGSLNDAAAAAVVGGAVAWLHGRATAHPAWSRLADGLAAFAAGAGSQLAAGAGAEPARVALAAVVVLAPGMALTTAAAEVAGGHWSSGTARASGAGSTLVQLGAGLAVAGALVPALPAAVAIAAAPGFAVALAQLALPPAIAVLGKARRVDLAPAVLVAYAVTLVARGLTGPAGALVGAALASAAGVQLGRWRRVPPVVFQTPALYLLVPGSLGVEALRRAIDGGPGAATAWSVAAVVVALAAGMLVGHAASGPRVARSTPPATAGT